MLGSLTSKVVSGSKLDIDSCWRSFFDIFVLKSYKQKSTKNYENAEHWFSTTPISTFHYKSKINNCRDWKSLLNTSCISIINRRCNFHTVLILFKFCWHFKLLMAFFVLLMMVYILIIHPWLMRYFLLINV